MNERLFHRYNPHETITFLSYEGQKRHILYVDSEGMERETVLQADLSFDIQSVKKGDRLRVQYGTITNNTSSRMGGTRWNSYRHVRNGQVHTKHIKTQIYTDGRCINAIGHDNPKVELASLLLMEAFFGTKEMRQHLADFRLGASTRQKAIEVKCGRRKPSFHMSMDYGILTASGQVAERICLGSGVLTLQDVALTETIITSLPGRPLADLVIIPGWKHENLVIMKVITDMNAVRVQLDTRLLTIDEALDQIADPVARTA